MNSRIPQLDALGHPRYPEPVRQSQIFCHAGNLYGTMPIGIALERQEQFRTRSNPGANSFQVLPDFLKMDPHISMIKHL